LYVYIKMYYDTILSWRVLFSKSDRRRRLKRERSRIFISLGSLNKRNRRTQRTLEADGITILTGNVDAKSTKNQPLYMYFFAIRL